MLRNLVTLLIALPALWLSIQVFGWIVSGEVRLAGIEIHRDKLPTRFWTWIIALSVVCCGILSAAMVVFAGIV